MILRFYVARPLANGCKIGRGRDMTARPLLLLGMFRIGLTTVWLPQWTAGLPKLPELARPMFKVCSAPSLAIMNHKSLRQMLSIFKLFGFLLKLSRSPHAVLTAINLPTDHRSSLNLPEFLTFLLRLPRLLRLAFGVFRDPTSLHLDPGDLKDLQLCCLAFSRKAMYLLHSPTSRSPLPGP